MVAFRSSRWLVTAAIVGGTAVVAALPKILPAAADPVPVLPALTPAELLDKVRLSKVTAFSGDLKSSVSLGLPSLGSFGGNVPRSLLDLLAGSTTAHVWVDGADHQRLALDGQQSETDWIHNGADLWSWDSTTQAVKHTTLKPDTSDGDATRTKNPSAGLPTATPAQAAADLLAMIDPSTEVSVRTPGYVAGRPVYELVVTPRSADSTIGAGVIAVDAATGMPLEVRIEARGVTSPAVKLSFTSISFVTPTASTFAFTPPVGSTTTEAAGPAELFPVSAGFGHDGHRRSDRAAAKDGSVVRTPSTTGGSPGGLVGPNGSTTVVGKDWTSIAIISGGRGVLGGQLGGLLSIAPAVITPGGPGHLLSTTLINVILLDDGRIAIGAVTPTALALAIPAS